MSAASRQFHQARAAGLWISDTAPTIAPPSEAAGHATEPPRRRPGRPRKSPDTPPVEAPAGDTLAALPVPPASPSTT